jgi:hypothetical protein
VQVDAVLGIPRENGVRVELDAVSETIMPGLPRLSIKMVNFPRPPLAGDRGVEIAARHSAQTDPGLTGARRKPRSACRRL